LYYKLSVQFDAAA